MIYPLILYRRRRRASGSASISITTQSSNNDGYVNNYANLEFTVAATSTNTAYTGNMTISKKSGSGTLGGTLTVAAVAGVATFDDLTYDAEDAAVFTVTPADTVAAGAAADTASETFRGGDYLLQNEWTYYDDVVDVGVVSGATQTGGSGSDFEWTGLKSDISMIETISSAKPVIGDYAVNFASDKCGDKTAGIGEVDNISLLHISTHDGSGNRSGIQVSDTFAFGSTNDYFGVARRSSGQQDYCYAKLNADGFSLNSGVNITDVAYRAGSMKRNAFSTARFDSTYLAYGAIDDVTIEINVFGIGDNFSVSQPQNGDSYLWAIASEIDFADATVYSDTKPIVNNYLTIIGAGVQIA